MPLPPFAQIRIVRLGHALDVSGLRWVAAPAPPFEMLGDWLAIEGIATWDDHAFVEIKERIDTRASPEPIRYEYNLGFMDGNGDHQLRQIHFHDPGRRKPADVCHNACHRHSYVGVPGGSERPKLPPCVCTTIEDALYELLEIYFSQYPPPSAVRLRGTPPSAT